CSGVIEAFRCGGWRVALRPGMNCRDRRNAGTSGQFRRYSPASSEPLVRELPTRRSGVRMPGGPSVTDAAPERVPFAEALRFWLKLGFISFGGPAGQIAILHAELVERRRWISERRFLHALNYCMLLPGPEAQQLATYIGWLLHRRLGGIV